MVSCLGKGKMDERKVHSDMVLWLSATHGAALSPAQIVHHVD